MISIEIITYHHVAQEPAGVDRGRSWVRQKELNHLSANIKTYHRDTETLRHAKDAFEKAFDAKNTDIRRTLTTELDRIHE
jgi:hypothetical protein